jgi:hypothetical protein
MPLPVQAITNCLFYSAVSGNLRLRQRADDETIARIEPSSPFSGKGKKILIALIIGLITALLTKAHFATSRFYRAEGRIAIHGLTEANRKHVLERHLFALQTGSLQISPEDPKITLSLRDFVTQGKISIFPSGQDTISLLVTDSDRRNARLLANQFTQNYVAKIIAEQNAMGQKLNDDQAKLLAKYQSLQKNHAELKSQIDKLTATLPTETMDIYLSQMADALETKLRSASDLLEKLNQINANILHYRGEIVHPTITLDRNRLTQIKNADRRYNGDYNLLSGRHTMYLATLKPEIQGLTASMQALRENLQAVLKAIAKQLELKLPADLSDDLLEMSLAVEKYEGQLARFQERWTRYSEKLLAMLASPAEADFDGTQTLLSQLRQDLVQRCSTLPNHLTGLARQLREGRSQEGKPGTLSNLTARNVADSAITGELEAAMDNWRKVNYHLNRLFPDGNVTLLTLGRICRSLQWRLNLRASQLQQELEEQQIAAQKREAQVQLDLLQKEFQKTSSRLTDAFKSFHNDEQKIADVSRRWPEADKAKNTLAKIATEMAELEMKLSTADKTSSLETLETLPVIVQGYTHAGFDTQHENGWAFFLAILATILTAALTMPDSFLQLWRQSIYPQLKRFSGKKIYDRISFK